MTQSTQIVIGVLAIQGAFREHIQHLVKAIDELGLQEKLEISVFEVRDEETLVRCDALVIPGGESTTMSLVAQRLNLLEPLRQFIASGKPAWGTCAGLIMLSSSLQNKSCDQQLLGGLDIETTRNAFGRQLDSFIADLDYSKFIPGLTAFQTVFIRGPVISKILPPSPGKPKVEVLASLPEERGSQIIAVRQGDILGTSFHPELSEDVSFHKWWVQDFVLSKITIT
ncbi:Protein of unconfirmed function [Komagataella phaffii CBS 7435]|uniref:glutaminase n=2 Tax=Komagataella phaffii TaxID=460519 RepID=C4QYB3_KOMPG|nr:uncharacterized protein PAS_chr1-4_0392 [Komagataella phaffii GS115]AOA61098.1 GQ67_01775T0 [Komagataella phaffii]CAH2447059.1 Protein of unconfirmed function [Komagataella phaffii CBS 7435]AOA65771.1 GQ68_01790T0 [Komagataella phaffii GS115]CAY68236.1 hypothetical protein PAS_chr1-4_0392 [Komagataella phaffii GS115]CCA37307.1 Protein of unconfirmed function [Komagataella phaffii CBS 7435]